MTHRKKIIINDCTQSCKVILGKQGEYNVQDIIFDCTDYVNIYGEGTAELIYTINKKTHIIPIVQSGKTVVWTVGKAETAVAGAGVVVLRWHLNEDDGLKISNSFDTYVLPSHVGDISDQSEYIDWIEKATALLKELEDFINEDALRSIIESYDYITKDDLKDYSLEWENFSAEKENLENDEGNI